jgi:hypothetical protein
MSLNINGISAFQRYDPATISKMYGARSGDGKGLKKVKMVIEKNR